MLADRHQRPDSLHFRTNTNNSGRASSDLKLSSFRAKPYPLAGPQHTNYRRAPAGNSDGQWSHDLFEEDSDIYEPKIRFKADLTLPAPTPNTQPQTAPQTSTSTSASINSRVFASTGMVNRAVSQPGTGSSATSLSLLSRMQSGSRPSIARQPPIPRQPPAAQAHVQIPPPPVARLDPSPGQIRKARELQEQQKRQAMAQQAYEAAMEKYMTGPVILEISNLAEGTSVDDVTTAFGDFGEIIDCTTEEGPMHGFQPTLKAKMVFVKLSDAQKAAEALNGVLADGLVLGVQVLSRYGKKPDLADFMNPSVSSSDMGLSSKTPGLVTSPSVTQSMVVGQQEDVDMKPIISAEPMHIDPPPPSLPAAPTGKLRSEALSQSDPGASLIYEPRPTIPYKLAPQPLLTNRVKPAPVVTSSSSMATDKLIKSIGISSDAMKIMSRLQGPEPSSSSISNHRKNLRNSGMGSGNKNQNRSGGSGGKLLVSKGGGKSSLLARMGGE